MSISNTYSVPNIVAILCDLQFNTVNVTKMLQNSKMYFCRFVGMDMNQDLILEVNGQKIICKKDNSFLVCSSCKANTGKSLHECPYKSELFDDYSLCDCCEDCTQNCRDDI